MKKILLFFLLSLSGILVAQEFRSYEQPISGTHLSFKMMPVAGGKFKMGSSAEPDEQSKMVEVSSFWMAATEVTFAEWDAYFKDQTLPQSKIIDGVTRATPQYIDLTWGMGRDQKHPSNSMSQLAAIMYCRWLFEKTGIFYRLPTEAEWEYACKTGATEQNLDLAAWFKKNSAGKFHHVMEKKPNTLGIYDMLGNLSEWTLDQYLPGYGALSAKDPLAPPAAKYPRVIRGGSYLDDATVLRCSNRIPSDALWNQRDPQIPKSKWWLTDGMFVGIRVVRPLQQPARAEALRFYDTYLK
jgi:formylglycine-generating enzyme required for sulfatase activity